MTHTPPSYDPTDLLDVLEHDFDGFFEFLTVDQSEKPVCPPPAHEGRSDSLAAPAEAGQGVCIQLPEGAQVLGIYVDAVDGVTYQWGSCTDGYFALDMFGWAAWPTLVDVVHAISRRAGYVA